MPRFISLKVCDALYDLIAAEARKRGVPMNEAVAQIVAERFRKPKLGVIPRKSKTGRPRKNQVKADW